MATTLPEIMDALDGISERVRWCIDKLSKLDERLELIEAASLETNAWVSELHEAAMGRDSGQP